MVNGSSILSSNWSEWRTFNFTPETFKLFLSHTPATDSNSLHNHSVALEHHVANTRRQLQLLLQSYYASDTTLEVLLYSLLFVLGAVGNLFLLAQLLGWKQRKSRANLLFLHLTLADLLVVLIIIPKEIFWRLTFSWRASEALCKLLHYLGSFSLYLSSFMIVSIGLNRFRAFVNPLSFHREHEHNLLLLFGSYLLSSLMSIPQVSLHLSFWFSVTIHIPSIQSPLFSQLLYFIFFFLGF